MEEFAAVLKLIILSGAVNKAVLSIIYLKFAAKLELLSSCSFLLHLCTLSTVRDWLR